MVSISTAYVSRKTEVLITLHVSAIFSCSLSKCLLILVWRLIPIYYFRTLQAQKKNLTIFCTHIKYLIDIVPFSPIFTVRESLANNLSKLLLWFFYLEIISIFGKTRFTLYIRWDYVYVCVITHAYTMSEIFLLV